MASVAALSAVLLPFRSHVSIATTGLVLVIPVVAGVIAGGYAGGVISVAAGFLVYDFVFIPPYYTLTVGAAQNWVALAVYVVVMLLVAFVVVRLQWARAEAQRRAGEAQRLMELSELLVADDSVDELLQTIVRAVRTAFDVSGVALMLPDGHHLSVAAEAGDLIDPEELRRLEPDSGVPVRVGTGPGSPGLLRAVALTAAGGPVGILVLKGLPESDEDRALLRTFANHAAVAIERAQLRATALRTEMLEASERVRRDLLGAVSHDLRTPLATMKVASSTLLDPAVELSEPDRRELHDLLDVQTDRLTRLVTSLLDLTRYQAGTLTLDRAPSAVLDLVGEAVAAVRPSLGDRPVTVDLPESLPAVNVDPVLIGQVIVNLLDNADRQSPPGSEITISATATLDTVAVAVTDCGPGVPRSERDAVFGSFVRFDTGGRAGLGLSIAKTFLDAHGEKIWVEESPGGGARFVFTLPVAQVTSNVVSSP